MSTFNTRDDYVIKRQGNIDDFIHFADLPIYVEEKMYDHLLDLVERQTYLNTILGYHAYLYKVYPVVLIEDFWKLCFPSIKIYQPAGKRSRHKCFNGKWFTGTARL